MVNMIPVALYARSSAIDEEAAFMSNEAQLQRMREYAERNGMNPVSHFVDGHGSKQEFDWMLAQATSGNPPFRTILIYSFNRLTRSAAEMSALLEETKAKGVDIISVTQPQNHLIPNPPIEGVRLAS